MNFGECLVKHRGTNYRFYQKKSLYNLLNLPNVEFEQVNVTWALTRSNAAY